MGGVAAVSAAVACQAIVGVEERTVDPIAAGCSLPQNGSISLKVANFVPSDETVDFCVRPSGAEWGRPIFRGGGNACPTGLSFGQMTADFKISSARVDIKTVPAGSTCKAAAISERTGVDLTGEAVNVIARTGNATVGESFVAFSETTTPPGVGKLKLRFGNFMPGGPALRIGSSAEGRPPTNVQPLFIEQAIAYGELTTKDTKATAVAAFDPDGYMNLSAIDWNVGLVPQSSTRAEIAMTLKRLASARSLFAIGDPKNPFFPPRAVVCQDALRDESGLLTTCTLSPLGTITADVWNAGLYGAFALYENERRPFVLDGIAKRNSDLFCITEVYRKSDRDAIIEQAKANGWNSAVSVDTDLDSKAADPTLPNGETPPENTNPGCGGVAQQDIDAAYQCMIANCSTTGTADGVLQGGSACLSEKCAGPMATLLYGDYSQRRCFNCVLVNALSYETHAAAKEACLTDPRPQFAFKGSVANFMLSRFPIKAQETIVLPSTYWRRAVHYAQVEIEAGKTLDTYCAQLTPSLRTLMPYTGAYAGGDESEEAWHKEALVQLDKVIAYVKKKSGDRPAIVLGDWVASKAGTDASGAVAYNDLNPQVHTTLEAAFKLAVARNHTPACTRCPNGQNPLNGETTLLWSTRPYLHNFKGEAPVQGNEIFFKDLAVPVAALPGGKGPRSDQFGFSAQIARPE